MTEPLTLWHLAWPFTTLSFLLYWTWKAAWGLLRPFLSRHPVLVSWEFCGFLNYPRILRCLWLPSFLKGTLLLTFPQASVVYGCLSCYLLFLMAVNYPLPHNNFKWYHQASAPGGLWIRWNKRKACVSPQEAARQIRTGKHSHLWRHSALLPLKPEPRAPDQECRPRVEPSVSQGSGGQGQ